MLHSCLLTGFHSVHRFVGTTGHCPFSILVYSLHGWTTVMSLKMRAVQYGQTKLEAAFFTPFFHLHGASIFSSSPRRQARCHFSPILVPHVGCGYRVVEPQQPRKWNRSGPYCLRFANKLSAIWLPHKSKHIGTEKELQNQYRTCLSSHFFDDSSCPSVLVYWLLSI